MNTAQHETTRAWSDIPFFRKPWGSFFLLLMCWPLYIIMWSGEFYYRKKGVVRTRSLAFKIVLTMAALIVGSFFFQLSSLGQNLSKPRLARLELPACTSEAVKRLASQILTTASGNSLLSFAAKAAAYDPQLEIRTCSFTAITTLERHEGFFTVRWTDKANGLYFVEM